MEKRLFLAFTLSLAVLFLFQSYIAKQQPQKKNVIFTQPQKQAAAPSLTSEAQNNFVEENKGRKIKINTAKYTLEFSDDRATLGKIELPEFRDRSGNPEILVSSPGPYMAPFATNIPDEPSVYNFREETNKISFCGTSDGKLELCKNFIFSDDKYTIEMELIFKNVSSQTSSYDYEIIASPGITAKDDAEMRFVEVSAEADGVLVKSKRPRDGKIFHQGIISWVGVKNRYFSVVLKPYQATESYFVMPADKKNMGAGLKIRKFDIPPGGTVIHKYVMYAGPNMYNSLKKLDLGIENIVDYGFFGSISKMLLGLLNFGFFIFKNWGMSIILLSVLVNVILFPLTLKSFTSMKRLQALQPHMDRLKSSHKDNPQKLNKEIMGLYKEHKVNPFGGCLPLILQMPIFIALYNAFMRAFELKGATFIWIKDLSGPDAVRLPFSMPMTGNSINILPILMAAAMFVQQKFSMTSTAISEEQKQQQMMMGYIMPVMFCFIFYNMPSGLVLYWLVNTILTAVEQKVILGKAR